jgi:hypothetical protein
MSPQKRPEACWNWQLDTVIAELGDTRVMSNDHNGAGFSQVAQKSENLSHKSRVEVGGGLVSDDEFDVTSKHSCNGDSLTLTTTEHGALPIDELRKADLCQGGCDT